MNFDYSIFMVETPTPKENTIAKSGLKCFLSQNILRIFYNTDQGIFLLGYLLCMTTLLLGNRTVIRITSCSVRIFLKATN